MVSIQINKSNFQLYSQHFIIDWMHPPPVKMVNYGKLLENMVRGNFSLFISYTNLSNTLWIVLLLSLMTILQKMCRKFNIELYLL